MFIYPPPKPEPWNNPDAADSPPDPGTPPAQPIPGAPPSSRTPFTDNPPPPNGAAPQAPSDPQKPASGLPPALPEGPFPASPPAPSPPPQYPAASPDPRAPIQKLVSLWWLEKEKSDASMLAIVNDASQESQKATRENLPNVDSDPAAADKMANAAEWATAAMNVAQKEGIDQSTTRADAHVSDSAPIFKNWHLSTEQLQAEYDGDLWVEIKDAGILQDIAAARAVLPPIPRGRGADRGKLLWQEKGWMFSELLPDKALLEDASVKDDDLTSEQYGTWMMRQIERRFTAAAEAFAPIEKDEADPAWLKTRDAKFLVSSCIAIFNQEGAPSSINTWDTNVLTWGVGIAEPGQLGRTFATITKNPLIAKAFYLCGFRYEGATPVNDKFYYGYQVVFMPKQSVVYRDSGIHKDKDKAKRGEHSGQAHKALLYYRDQVELLYLLIHLARDPVSRKDILDVNYQRVEGMAALSATDHILTEALFVFASEVRHNWALGPDLVQWAVNHLDPSLRSAPRSSTKDFEIAKWICRRILLWVQTRAIVDAGNAYLKAKREAAASKPAGTVAPVPVATSFPYGLKRLREGELGQGYWTALVDGSRTQTKPKKGLGDFEAASKSWFESVAPLPDPSSPTTSPVSTDPRLIVLAHDSMVPRFPGVPKKGPQWYALGNKKEPGFDVETFLPLGFDPWGRVGNVTDASATEIVVTTSSGLVKRFKRNGEPK
ncbi:Hypothetical protein A7982_02672 [Minicystis rosea]|nr:Hypothetical protein A7982_02672 [Minicystis rosea]